LEDTVPDARTLRLFQDTLTNKNTLDKLFRKFKNILIDEGLFAPQEQPHKPQQKDTEAL
jgi:hypothetical protein